MLRGKRAKRSTTPGRRRPRDEPDENDAGVELDEICARLNRIIDRSNRIDLQLSEIERVKGTSKLQSPTRITPTKYSPVRSINQMNSLPEAPLSLIDQDPLQGTPTKSSPQRINQSSTLQIGSPKVQRPNPPPKKEITLEMVYEELVALRQEVAAIAATQQEMKRELLSRR